MIGDRFALTLAPLLLHRNPPRSISGTGVWPAPPHARSSHEYQGEAEGPLPGAQSGLIRAPGGPARGPPGACRPHTDPRVAPLLRAAGEGPGNGAAMDPLTLALAVALMTLEPALMGAAIESARDPK